MPTIPERYRTAIRQQLDALARGDSPELLTWVHEYGPNGAVLVIQPEAIWTHPDSIVEARANGTAWGVVPLWTFDESPSDLSAELEIDVQGRAVIVDVRVL